MRKLRFLFWLRLAGTLALPMMLTPPAQAVLVTATVTLTNTPATSNAWTVNGDARYWTNAQTATTILTNSTGIAPSLTNLLSQIDLKPYLNVQHAWLTATQLTLKGSAVAVSFSGGGWATVSYVTNQGPIAYALLVPPTNVNASPIGVRTNNANYLADYFNLYGTTPLSTNAAFGSNYVTANPVPQSFGNKTMTNGLIEGARESNIVAWVGTVFRASNGFYITPGLLSPYTTNLTNFGLAISSPGTASGAENFGTGAQATNVDATAAGNGAIAGGSSSSAFGKVALAPASGAAAYGNNARALAPFSLAAGTGSKVEPTATNGSALGTLSWVQYVNSSGVGYNSTPNTNNQIMLGDTTIAVSVPGQLLISGSQSNTTFMGTNIFGGDASFPRANVAVANGVNLDVMVGTNRFVNFYGPTVAYEIDGFDSPRADKEFTLLKTNSFTLTIGNDTATPTLSHRILTGTGANATITNNPGFARFIYIGDLQKWALINKSN